MGVASDAKNIKNYYVLTLLMAGMIDDFKDALDEIIRAANLPISVIVVKIGSNSDENDSTLLLKNSLKAFDQAERVFIDLLDYEKYKDPSKGQSLAFEKQFEYDIIKNIPKQVEKFFELQHLDVSNPKAELNSLLSFNNTS